MGFEVQALGLGVEDQDLRFRVRDVGLTALGSVFNVFG